ncbi:MAG: DUF2846 domain-containing protein [Candidatus Omnitrophica bacterium]|nr:DUF2846 domain-containing protein [Candidatus Omnitrophota bacterium]
MKRLQLFLAPMIMSGVLVLSGCEPAPGSAAYNSMLRHPLAAQVTGGSTSAPTLGPSFKQAQIPAGKAVVFIYRPAGSGVGGAALPFDVKANGKALTTLTQGGYYAYVTEPGNIEFTAFDTGFMAPSSIFSIAVDAKAGLAYYLKGAHGKGTMGRAHLELVSPEAGAHEIADCKLTTTQ